MALWYVGCCLSTVGRWSDRSYFSIIWDPRNSRRARGSTFGRIRTSGLATVTYLFSGSLEHRDNLGNVRVIEPGDVNWMTAGSGIAHSERTPRALRAAGPQIHGIQSWVALPDGHEDVPPTFAHHAAASLPTLTRGGVELTLIAGRGFGLESPVETAWPTLYADILLQPGASLEIPDEHTELAVYVVAGSVDVAGVTTGVTLAVGQMGILTPRAILKTAATAGAARLMLLGGATFDTPRHLFWNFVASSPQRIEAAKTRWRQQQFAPVPLETEFIPLPS